MKFSSLTLVRRAGAVALLSLPLFAAAQSGVPAVTVVYQPAKLQNLAVRSTLAPNEAVLAGFVVSEPSTATLLVRASGPALAPLGVTGAMPNPRLKIVDSAGKTVAENDDWSAAVPQWTADNPQWSVQQASQMVGAFAFPTGSRDAALVITLTPGAYTLEISGSSGTDAGSVLGEIYQMPVLEALPVAVARGDKAGSRLLNLSARGRVTENAPTIAGFAVGGGPSPGSVTNLNLFGVPVTNSEPPPSRRFLIRAVGPSLAPFGVTAALADPTLEIAGANGRIVQANDNWESEPTSAAAVREATAEVGAFPLASGSRDAAVVVQLTEGAYSVVVRGANSSTGNALVEIYELED